jgi:hypothetical protein
LIAVAVTHQLKRPALAKILDAEELRLPLAADLKRQSTRLRKTIRDILSQADMPEGASDTEVMVDLMGIIKGMVDAAGARKYECRQFTQAGEEGGVWVSGCGGVELRKVLVLHEDSVTRLK